MLGCRGEAVVELLLVSLGRLEAVLADSEGAWGKVVGSLAVFRPERVSSAGAYSTDDSREWESGEGEVEKVVLMLEASEFVRCRFLDDGLGGVSTDDAGAKSRAGVLFDVMRAYFGFLGPRFIPGLPRPRPLPETIVPSSNVYCFTLRAEVVTSRLGGGIGGVSSSLYVL